MPTIDHCSALASFSGINDHKANDIINEVLASISKWKEFADMAKIEKSEENKIAIRINQIKKEFYKKNG